VDNFLKRIFAGVDNFLFIVLGEAKDKSLVLAVFF